MAAKNNTIALSEGLEQFNLVFTDRDDDAVTISFNPYDTDIVIRISQSQENISRALDEFKGEGESSAETLERINGVIYDEIDRIFDSKISDKVFKHCSPLSLDAKGVTFAERFLNAVTPHITGRIQAANKASAARIAKHTGKYVK
ncbi:MAG: hypothetical protein IJU41_03625 [Clostridia bacterium]|nr:hypothetical protein [Clostridia bacterium]